MLEGYYGVVLARAIVMPLNVRLSPLELKNILNHSGARMLLFENDFAPLVEQLKPACPDIQRFVALDEKGPAADLSYEELLDQGHTDRADIFSFDENSIAELFYTSGSTGTPKGVTLSHRTLYMHALAVATLYREPETIVDLHTIPLFHANGWGRPQASTMLGTKQIMIRRFEPIAVFRSDPGASRHRHGAGSHHGQRVAQLSRARQLRSFQPAQHRPGRRSLLARADRAHGKCVPLRRVRGLRPDGDRSAAHHVSCSKPGFTYASDADRYRRRSMAGWPVIGMQVRVVDPEMNDVPRDMQTIGEIVTCGDHVMEGYFREPEATASVMSGPWFHTGDMAVWDEETLHPDCRPQEGDHHQRRRKHLVHRSGEGHFRPPGSIRMRRGGRAGRKVGRDPGRDRGAETRLNADLGGADSNS